MRRVLPPLAPKQSASGSEPPPQPSTIAQARPSQPHYHHPREWESLRSVIENLLTAQGLKIKDVLLVLENEYSFKTGERSLKSQLKKWGIRTNLPKAKMEALIMKEHHRKFEGKNTIFTLNGLPINSERLATFKKRHAKDSSHASQSNVSTPEGVQYFTPQDPSPDYLVERTEVGEAVSPPVILEDNLPSSGHLGEHVSGTSQTIPDPLTRLQLLFADIQAPTGIRRQSIIRDIRALLVTSGSGIVRSSPYHAGRSYSNQKSDSRLLQFLKSFGTGGLILDQSSIRRKYFTGPRTLRQDSIIDKIDYDRFRIELHTTHTFSSSSSSIGTSIVRKSQVLRVLPARVLTKPASEPILVLSASVIEESTLSICSLSVDMMRPNSALVFQTISTGDLQGFKLLLELGQASIRDQDEYGASLLMYAFDQPEICKFLIDEGLDVDHKARSSGVHETLEDIWDSPLTVSTQYNYYFENVERRILQCRQILLEAGADPTMEIYPMIPVLDKMLGHRNKAFIRHLWNSTALNMWVSVSTYDFFRITCILQQTSIIEELLRLGAKPDINDKNGWRVLSRACTSSCPNEEADEFAPPSAALRILQLLIDAGLDPNTCDPIGVTPAHFAYYNGKSVRRYGSASGDIFDAALARCGRDIEASHRSTQFVRYPVYTEHYSRDYFERLWEGIEYLCPYWGDEPWPADLAAYNSDNSDNSNNSEDSDDEDEGHPLDLTPMLADIEDMDYGPDLEVVVIRDIVPESLGIEDEEQLDFNFG